MSANKFSGVITALSTPFIRGQIDEASFRRLVRAQIKDHISGFVVNGTTGESPTLQIEDVRRLYDWVREESPVGTRVIVGTGGNSTATTIEFSKTVAQWNPDALLVVVPYYNKPPQRGLKLHFEMIADQVNVPILLYNVPGRTVASLEPETIELLSRHGNIMGIKDATGDISVLRSIRQRVPSDFELLSGDDLSCVEFVENGGHGVISVSSHLIGREMIAFFDRARNGDGNANFDFRTKYKELMRLLYVEANPIPVKTALKLLGIFESAELRLPLVELDSRYVKELESCLAALGKI